MIEKLKHIPVPEWLESAVSEEAKNHHRSWSREAVVILENYIRANRPDLTKE